MQNLGIWKIMVLCLNDDLHLFITQNCCPLIMLKWLVQSFLRSEVKGLWQGGKRQVPAFQGPEIFNKLPGAQRDAFPTSVTWSSTILVLICALTLLTCTPNHLQGTFSCHLSNVTIAYSRLCDNSQNIIYKHR